MAVTILCEKCGTPALVHELVASCPKCTTQLPDATRRDLELGLLEQKVKRPFLLRLGQFLSAASAISAVTGMVVIRTGVIPALAVLGVSTLGLGAIAVGLHLEKRWARPLMVGFWPALAAALAWRNGVPLGLPLASHSFLFAIPTSLAALYLYRYPAARRYYRLLQLQDGDDSPGDPVSLPRRHISG